MFNILTLSIWFLFHPVHVTFTSIDHIPGTDSLKVFCRMYFDDFLHDYQTYDDDRDLTKIFGNQQPLPEDLVNNYFNAKVCIYVNNKLLIGKLLSVILADNELRMKLYYRADKKPKSITVRNIMLTGWYSDQENMIVVRTEKFEKGIKLTPGHNEETFIIK